MIGSKEYKFQIGDSVVHKLLGKGFILKSNEYVDFDEKIFKTYKFSKAQKIDAMTEILYEESLFNPSRNVIIEKNIF